MRAMTAALIIIAAAAAPVQFGRELTPEDMETLAKGEIVKEVKREQGTQHVSWSVGMFDYPPEIMWKVICSLELYDEYMDRTTVSVLLDEDAKNRVVKSGLTDADEVEKLFEGMKPGYRITGPDGVWTVYSYQRNNFPWPVSDRWVLLEITHDDKAMKQSWRWLAGNIEQDYGKWVLKPAPGGKTMGINDIHLDFGVPAPSAFIAFAMSVTLPDTYVYFENMAQDMAKDRTP